MDELLKSLSRFFTRDVIFIIGGATIIAAFAYCLDVWKWDISWPYLLFIAGISYALGWATQDLFCLFGIATTANYFEAGRFARFVYKRYQKKPWKQPKQFDTNKVRTKVDFAPLAIHSRLERFITLKLLGMTMGPCTLICTGLLLLRAINTKAVIDYTLSTSALISSFVFISLGWVKACEQLIYMSYLDLVLPDPTKTQK
jgi:hypothetical protein